MLTPLPAMAAQVTVDRGLPNARSSVGDDLTIAQLAKSKCPLLAPFPPLNPLRVKLKKSKLSANGEEKPSTTSKLVVRTGEVQSDLGTHHPSFVKTMLRSHVSGGFWMGLPAPFCKSFLPKNDATIVVEDDDGEKYNMKYIARRSGLSGGWRRFAVVHKLREDDLVVFHLVESCKFKVYIVRANGSKEIEGTLDLLNSKAHAELTIPDASPPSSKPSGRKRPRSLPQITAQKLLARASSPQPSHHSVVPEGSRSHEPELSKVQEGSRSHEPELSNVSEGSRSRGPELPFEKVETFQDFRIVVDGQCVDSELPVDVRTSYYKLCMDRKELLHDGLPDGLYPKLAAGVIGQTVRIADEIQNCRSSTTKADFRALDKVLKSLELLGMKVGFLRARIRTLVSLVFESERLVRARRLAEARAEQKRAAWAVKRAEAELRELRKRKREADEVVDGLKREGERCEGEFKEKGKAPW